LIPVDIAMWGIRFVKEIFGQATVLCVASCGLSSPVVNLFSYSFLLGKGKNNITSSFGNTDEHFIKLIQGLIHFPSLEGRV
jgi:hypothetical protein